MFNIIQNKTWKNVVEFFGLGSLRKVTEFKHVDTSNYDFRIAYEYYCRAKDYCLISKYKNSKVCVNNVKICFLSIEELRPEEEW